MFDPLTGPMTTVVRVQNRTATDVNGAKKLSYTDAETAPVDSCQWKGKGGTEDVKAGVLVYSDTAEVVMWYRTDISIHDRLLLNDDQRLAYEIISPPENIENRNMRLMFNVKRMGGA